jgi:predicted amidophosphoribosyltransferase
VKALDLLLPLRCALCGRGEQLLCAACLGALAPVGPPLCALCGSPTVWPVERCSECAGRRIAFRTARSAVAYDETGRAFVRAWKERGLRDLGRHAASRVAEAVPRPDAAAIAFVPGDRDRTRWRGHSTAESLARELAAGWDLPVVRALGRTGRTLRQRGLSREARRANIRTAFRPLGMPPRRLVLVDDVYTTGATASAAASALRKADVRSVDVVTFARTLRKP